MKLLPFSILLFFLLLIGCTKEPNSVGKDILDDNADKLKTAADTSIAVSSSGYAVTSANNSPTLLVGKSNNTEAKMLLQFGTFAIDTTKANSIISVKIKLKPNYSFKDTVGVMAFSIHKMSNVWSEYNFTADSLAGSYESAPINTYSFNASSKDTLTIFDLDKNLVSDWLKGVANDGIILVPDAGSNVIFGFDTYYYSSASDARPQLEIVYRTATDTADQTITLRTTQDATVFSGTRPISTSSLFYVQGGFINRGKLKFDVSNIPRGAAITQAFLEMKTDSIVSAFGSYTDYQIQVHDILKDDSIPSLSGTTATGKLSGNTFTIDIRSIVQPWVNGKANYGIAIRLYNEFTQVDRIAIFGSAAADSTNKPRLRIQYTYLP
jgi:hypothetical protein